VVRTALVHNPENPPCRGVGFTSHHLPDQAIKRLDPIGLLQASDHPGPPDVVGSQVRPRATTIVLVFDALTSSVCMDFAWVESVANLNARLLVGRDDELVAAKATSFPDTRVQVQDRCCTLEEQRVAGPDPRMVPPWLQRIGIQDAPDRGLANGFDVILGDQYPLDVGNEEPAERLLVLGRQLAGNSLNQDEDLGREKSVADPNGACPQGRSLQWPSDASTCGWFDRAPPQVLRLPCYLCLAAS